jgi:hypothetical protein
LPAFQIAGIERLVSRDRVEHRGRLLRIVVALDGAVEGRQQLILIIVVEPLHLGRLEALSEEVVDGPQQCRSMKSLACRRTIAVRSGATFKSSRTMM